jgi:hypothetical protein
MRRTTDPRLLALRVLTEAVNAKVEKRVTREVVTELIGLLDRASADLQAGWPEAALDCIGRARKLLRDRAEGKR